MSPPPPPRVERVLIANRGEIARRVIRACRELGITSIAVYTDADKDLPFVAEAGRAVCLGADPGGYMDVEKVLAAAQQAKADAIHPGYGFLSERADFAKRVEDAGMVFVGPTPHSIEQMGSKIAAKKLLKDAVPLVPGKSSGTHPEWLAFAKEIGYPVLVKASAGGGGRGMHVANDEKQLAGILEKAEAEAKRLFGEPDVMLEKYLPSVKHIEVQIFGDAHGDVIHLLDRECSLQRRHQKVIEEAPSPSISDALRRDILAAAVRIGKVLSYRGAGTVEFVVDTATQGWYFLEVNTRLQVEHPVTELVTNVDLVKLQFHVARGGRVREGLRECRLRAGCPVYTPEATPAPLGHAIEARLYAEDFNLQPTVGKVEVWDPRPRGSAAHTVDPHRDPHGAWSVDFHDAVRTGSVITTNYDNMISKVVAWDRMGRARAAQRLQATLENITCFGLPTNKLFLIAMLAHPDYLADAPGRQTITTKWIERTLPALQAQALAGCLSREAVVRASVACGVLASLPQFSGEAGAADAGVPGVVAAGSNEPSRAHLRQIPRGWSNTGSIGRAGALAPARDAQTAAYRATTRVLQVQASTHGILPPLQAASTDTTPTAPATDDTLLQVRYTRERGGAFVCEIHGPRGATAAASPTKKRGAPQPDYLSRPLLDAPLRVEICAVGPRDAHGGHDAILQLGAERWSYYVRRGTGQLPVDADDAAAGDEPGHPAANGQPTDVYYVRGVGDCGGAELAFLKVPRLCYDDASGAICGIPATLPPTQRDFAFAAATPFAAGGGDAASASNDEAGAGKAPPAGTPVRSPMMAKVFRTVKTSGDAVKEGDVVVVLESMKMETEIRAPHAGTVALRVKKDDLTRTGNVLFHVAK